MLGIAAGVQCELTSFIGVNVFVLLNMVCTPWAKVVVNQRARPLIQVLLLMPWMKIKIAELAMFCNDFEDGAAAVGTLDSERFVGALVFGCWFPNFER